MFRRTSWAFWIVCLLVVLYVLLFALISVRRHDALLTAGYDLGNMDQAVWNTIYGRILRFTMWEGGTVRLAAHVEPILILLSPLYLLYSSPKTLLILQTVVIALGTFPVYWLARDRLENDLAAVIFATAYLLFPGLEAANVFDFHAVSLSTSLLLYTFYFVQKRQYVWFSVFALLSVACKEEISLVIAMMGLYILLVQGMRWTGIVVTLAGIAWFYVAVYVIIPYFGSSGASPYLPYYSDLGENPLEIGLSLIARPGTALDLILSKPKIDYLYGLLFPFAFSSLLAPHILFLSFPSLAINFFSRQIYMGRPETLHYQAPLAPFLVLAAIYGQGFVADWLHREVKVRKTVSTSLLAGLMLMTTLNYHRFHGFTPLAVGFRWPLVTARHLVVEELAAQIPAQASVSASHRLIPHVSQRETVYLFPRVEDAQYIFLDILPTDLAIITRDVYESVRELLESGQFGVVASKNGFLLLKKGLANPHLSDDFYDFAQPGDREIQHPLTVNFVPINRGFVPINRGFGDKLQLLGFDVREEERTSLLYLYLDLYWRITQPVNEDYRIFTFLMGSDGKIIEGTDFETAAPIWYPTSHWPPGAIVKVTTAHWSLDEHPELKVLVGVVEGPSQWELERRLLPRIVASDMVLGLRQADTLLELPPWRKKGRVAEFLTVKRLFRQPDIRYPLEATFDSQLRLLGYDLDETSIRPGDTLSVTLYWQALTGMRKSFTVFAHLVDEANKIWGQKDSVPSEGARPTTGWVAKEIVLDRHQIPVAPDAPEGDYWIEVGLYDVSSGERLQLQVGGAEVDTPDDRILLTKVHVVR